MTWGAKDIYFIISVAVFLYLFGVLEKSWKKDNPEENIIPLRASPSFWAWVCQYNYKIVFVTVFFGTFLIIFFYIAHILIPSRYIVNSLLGLSMVLLSGFVLLCLAVLLFRFLFRKDD